MKASESHLSWQTFCAGAITAAVAIACGCKSGGSGAIAERAEGGTSIHQLDLTKFSPTRASICLQQMIKNPPVPFHLSFSENSSDSSALSVEADVTPLGIDYTKRETAAGQTSTTTRHLTRMSEMELDFDVMGPVPWHGELVAAQDAAKQAGTDNVNGYNALKYLIDTADEPAAQKATFESLMALKHYRIVGSAWVTSDTGCLVKYAVDFEQDRHDGSFKKTHFEGNVTKIASSFRAPVEEQVRPS